MAQWAAGSHAAVLVSWPPECVLNKPAPPSLLRALPRPPGTLPCPPSSEPRPSSLQGTPRPSSPSLPQASASATPLPEELPRLPGG